MIQNNKNQTLETAQLANRTPPPIFQPNIAPNGNNQPQNTPVLNNQVNPVISPVFQNSPSINVNVENKFDKLEHKVTRTHTPRLADLGPKSERITCPFCHEEVDTEISKSTNLKAFWTAIGTCYCGFACIQSCRKKEISCDDVEHKCPNCQRIVGKYYAM